MSGSDYKFGEKIVLPMDKVIRFEEALYKSAGMSGGDAACVARILAEAEPAASILRDSKKYAVLRRFEKGGNSVEQNRKLWQSARRPWSTVTTPWA
jgi:hypothetical protein